MTKYQKEVGIPYDSQRGATEKEIVDRFNKVIQYAGRVHKYLEENACRIGDGREGFWLTDKDIVITEWLEYNKDHCRLSPAYLVLRLYSNQTPVDRVATDLEALLECE